MLNQVMKWTYPSLAAAWLLLLPTGCVTPVTGTTSRALGRVSQEFGGAQWRPLIPPSSGSLLGMAWSKDHATNPLLGPRTPEVNKSFSDYYLHYDSKRTFNADFGWMFVGNLGGSATDSTDITVAISGLTREALSENATIDFASSLINPTDARWPTGMSFSACKEQLRAKAIGFIGTDIKSLSLNETIGLEIQGEGISVRGNGKDGETTVVGASGAELVLAVHVEDVLISGKRMPEQRGTVAMYGPYSVKVIETDARNLQEGSIVLQARTPTSLVADTMIASRDVPIIIERAAGTVTRVTIKSASPGDYTFLFDRYSVIWK